MHFHNTVSLVIVKYYTDVINETRPEHTLPFRGSWRKIKTCNTAPQPASSPSVRGVRVKNSSAADGAWSNASRLPDGDPHLDF